MVHYNILVYLLLKCVDNNIFNKMALQIATFKKLESIQTNILSIASCLLYNSQKITDDLQSSGSHSTSISPRLPYTMKPDFY